MASLLVWRWSLDSTCIVPVEVLSAEQLKPGREGPQKGMHDCGARLTFVSVIKFCLCLRKFVHANKDAKIPDFL
jgi:hypothetical protein